MWLKETKPECCYQHEVLPSQTQCFAPDICDELNRLYTLHSRAFVKNRRIMKLAKSKPRKRIHRFLNKCPCFFKKPIEIIRLEQREQTRTQQLAYPRARYGKFRLNYSSSIHKLYMQLNFRLLILFKQQVRSIFPPERMLNINRLIRKSLFSLYSRLGNVQPPMEM